MIHHAPVKDVTARRRASVHVAIVALLAAALAAPAVAGSDTPAASARQVVGARFALPLPGSPRVLRPFEQPPAPWAAGHRGVDLAAVPGGDVLAPGDGVVTFAGRVAGRPVVTVTLAGGRRSSVEPVAADVAAGDRVRLGEVVGTLAPRGWHCASSCLHWGVRVGVGGLPHYIDPMTLVRRDSPIVLLPDAERAGVP